jgi:hypothetical protein
MGVPSATQTCSPQRRIGGFTDELTLVIADPPSQTEEDRSPPVSPGDLALLSTLEREIQMRPLSRPQKTGRPPGPFSLLEGASGEGRRSPRQQPFASKRRGEDQPTIVSLDEFGCLLAAKVGVSRNAT